MDKNSNKDNLKIAGRHFETDDYNKKDQLSSGLATTHEQVSDTYMKGDIKPARDQSDSEDLQSKKD